ARYPRVTADRTVRRPPLHGTLPPSRSARLPHLFLDHPAAPQIYTLSLHDALPISGSFLPALLVCRWPAPTRAGSAQRATPSRVRSEEHTSELQSRGHLVCRLLLEKKKNDALAVTDSPAAGFQSLLELVFRRRSITF